MALLTKSAGKKSSHLPLTENLMNGFSLHLLAIDTPEGSGANTTYMKAALAALQKAQEDHSQSHFKLRR